MDYKSIIVQHNYTVEVQKPMLNITCQTSWQLQIYSTAAVAAEAAARAAHSGRGWDRIALIEFLNSNCWAFSDSDDVSTNTQCSAGVYILYLIVFFLSFFSFIGLSFVFERGEGWLLQNRSLFYHSWKRHSNVAIFSRMSHSYSKTGKNILGGYGDGCAE